MATKEVIQNNHLSINIHHRLGIWQRAKSFLEYIYQKADYILDIRRKITQKDILIAFYDNREYGEAFRDKSFVYLTDFYKLLTDTYELKQCRKELLVDNEKEDLSFFEFNEEELIDARNPEVIHLVASNWIDNRNTIQFTSIYPVLENKELLDLITELKIPFLSQKEPHLSKLVCSAINHVSSNKESLNHGNPNIGTQISNTADDFAKQIGPVIDKMTESGIKSSRNLAKELNKKRIKTLRGKKWSHTSVLRTHKRWLELNK
ncbi:hypothetical protein GCM10011531_07020 [Aquaticitalea lipolytica]|uniref:Recombinase domain-containing protein n=1 Tax=Aquaticitalea lipolytica TaxID=1247562 RepID=A0A8J2TMN7_9FLAO|nr:hypothetical protein [Aquaticitalea lipolytica]GFZ79704.1 hypothetical protein GCM10011531_07020 [Aquaticitalea lipolytica]